MSYYSVTSPVFITNDFLDSPLSPMLLSPPSSVFLNTPISVPMVSPMSDDPIIDSPVLSSLNLTYTKPTFGFYENMNADPELHERMVKHFLYYKTLGEWLYDEMSELLGYLEKGKDGKIRLINDIGKYKEDSVDSDSKDTIEDKIEYIKKNVLRKSDMMHILNNLVRETNTNWYDLPHKEYLVQKVIRRGLRKKLRKMIRGE